VLLIVNSMVHYVRPNSKKVRKTMTLQETAAIAIKEYRRMETEAQKVKNKNTEFLKLELQATNYIKKMAKDNGFTIEQLKAAMTDHEHEEFEKKLMKAEKTLDEIFDE
jgi:hypothetical protein